MKKLLFIGVVLIVLSSCSSSRTFYNKPQSDIHYGVAQDDLAVVEMAFIGALGSNFIFECTIDNISEREITIDQQDFMLLVEGQSDILPLDVSQESERLIQEQKRLKKQKKTNTILTIVGVGITALAGASSGASAGESIAFAAEPLIYMADDIDWSNRNIKSVDEEVAYLRSALFAGDIIAPGKSVTKDVLFAIEQIKGEVTLLMVKGNREYAVDFDSSLFRL